MRYKVVLTGVLVVAVGGISSAAFAESGHAPTKTADRAAPIATEQAGHDSLTPFEQAATPEPIVNVPAAGTPITSAAQAIALVKSHSAVIGRADSMVALPMRYDRLLAADGPDAGAAVPPGFSADQQIWAVAIVGDYRPQFAKGGEKYDWGVEIYDQATGVPLGTTAGPGPLPALFARA